MGSGKFVALGTAVLAVVGAAAATVPAHASESLYDRLGGKAFIECWIDESLAVITADVRIDDFFAGDPNGDQPLSLRTSLVKFACAATGGPCDYRGRNMACAHTGLGIGHSDFNAFIEDLEQGAEACAPNEAAYAELGKVLRSLRPQVVQDDPGESEAALATCS